MKYYITNGSLNWADEIDFDGFDLFTEDELKDAIKAFSDGGEYYDKEVSAYLGTNEDEDISSEDVLYELKEAEEITEAQYEAISDVLGDHYGVTCYGKFIDGLEYLEEDEESEDED
jgi:hypothetical protein